MLDFRDVCDKLLGVKAEFGPNWPFQIKRGEGRTEEVARRFEGLSISRRQSIAMALIADADRAITLRNGNLFWDMADPQYSALFGYRAAMLGVLQMDGVDTPDVTMGMMVPNIRGELEGDIKPGPVSTRVDIEAFHFWDDLTDKAGVTAMRSLVLDSINYHLAVYGNSDKELSHRTMIYMFGANHPSEDRLLADLQRGFGRPTLLGRVQAIRDYTILRDRMKELPLAS